MFRPASLLPATGKPRPVPPTAVPPPPATPSSTGEALTLDALMARQKQAAAMQGEAMQQPVANIPQGLAQMAWTVVNALQERRAGTELAQGQADVAKAMGTLNYDTGELAPGAMETLWQRDPESAKEMTKTAMALRAAKAKQENWLDIPAPEGAKPGQLYQRNTVTGEVRATGGQSVTQVGSGETEFDKKVGEKQAATYDALYNDGIQAAQDEINVGELEKVLATAGTGTGAGIKLWAKNRLGLELGDDVNDLQAADAIIAKLVPSQRAAGSGTISDRDIELFRSSLPSIWNQPGGNQKILRTMKGLIQYRKKQGEIASQVMNGALTRQDGLKALMSIPNPLAEYKQPDDPTTPPADPNTPPADPNAPPVEPYPPKPPNYAGQWPTQGAWAILSPAARAFYLKQVGVGQ
jgi:hypothetical protein